MEREFIELNKYPNYEITTEYPWIIRRKSDGYVVKPYLEKSTGYYCLYLENHKKYRLHHVVAEQYLENPHSYSEVDHISRCRTDNRLENLRFVPRSLNMRNRISNKGVKYEYLDELPDDYIPYTEYIMRDGRKRFFNNLFIKMSEDKPDFITDDSQQQYRVLHQDKHGYVNYNDTDGKNCAICFNRIIKAQTKLAETQKIIADTQAKIAETEDNLSKALLNMTEIIKTQQTQSQHPEEETSDEEYEHREPDEEDYRK
jgi:hypothetical protein